MSEKSTRRATIELDNLEFNQEEFEHWLLKLLKLVAKDKKPRLIKENNSIRLNDDNKIEVKRLKN